MQELKDLYDIYDFWYIPWWHTWWGITILSGVIILLIVLSGILIAYGIKKYRLKKQNEWLKINTQLGVLLQKHFLTKDEYQQLITLFKRKLVLCFDHSLQSKTDEELVVWLNSFPDGSLEKQLAPLFDVSALRFAPTSDSGYTVGNYIQMAFDYNNGKKVSP